MDKINRKRFLSTLGALGASAVVAPSILAHSNEWKKTEPLDRKIKVGIIGCGSVSGSYLPHLTKSPYADVVSLCDIKPERAENRAKEFNVSNWYPDIDQMLSGVEFDLFVNLTNMQEHGRLNKIAIQNRKHVWSEKPLANSYDEGVELIKLSEGMGVKLWGAPVVVNSPQFAFMAKKVNEGALGKIASATAHYGHQGPWWSAFFYEKLGGSLPDLGVYNIATLTGLFGPAKSIMAMTNIITPTRETEDKGFIEVKAEDNSHVLMEHQDGVLSHVQCGFNYFDPYGHGGTGQEQATISVWGSEGNMHMLGYDWKPSGVDMATVKNPETMRFSTDQGDYVWEQGASLICEHLATGKELLVNVEHSLHVLEIIEAARKSQSTGSRIELHSAFKWPIVA